MAGLYIHIPFCARRCIYCGFYSTTLLGERQRYVDALCREMTLRPERPEIGTIYLGGGTPSTLSHGQLRQLFRHIYKRYSISPTAEITIEMNPDDIRPGMLRGLPVNRVSMGAQTFSDRRLRFLRRRHTAAQVAQAVGTIRNEGIENISIDLMFGFPCETLDEWREDIRQALALHPEHLSAYSLMVEEGTPLCRLVEQGSVEEGDEELTVRMYDLLVDELTAAGYEHYEISNFALPGRRSRHNASYWDGTPYIGLGAAAHSYDGRTRQWNVDNLAEYLEAIERGQRPFEQETLDDDMRYNDLITTRLRTREGIALSGLATSYQNYMLENAASALRQGLLQMDNGLLRLTRKGIMVSNTVMSDLMKV